MSRKARSCLNGDYISDALAAQVGGIGIAPGGNINYRTGHAVFEATHGTAPKYANQDKVNPGSVVLSGELMLRHLGWDEAADLIVQGIEKAIADRIVTYDFARLMDGAKEVKCSEFGTAIIERGRRHGGNGGHVVLQVDPGKRTLLDFQFQHLYRARNGTHGQGKDMHGRNAPDLVIGVPPGTIVKDGRADP